MSAGLVALRFTTDGEEPHEILLFRKNDAVTESFDEILELPEGQERRMRMTLVGAAFADRGDSYATVFEAEAGEYIALCFLSVGATAEGPREEGDSPPHWVEGMRSEFTVE